MDVIDEIVENDNIDKSLLQQSPEAIDELDNPIVPEVPKTISGQQLFVYVPNASNDNLGLVEGSYKQRMLLTTDKKVLVDIVDGTIQNIYIKQNYTEEITWLKLNDYFKLLQDLINNITSGTTVVDKANKDSEGNVITDTYVSIKPQVFTDEQQAQARANIGAGAAVATIVKINNQFAPIVEFTSDPQTQITANTDDIATNTNSINDIKSKIPNQASADNQLADKNFVNSSINNIAAFYITKDAQRNAFETHAQLFSATVFYSAGEVRVPTKNDYCIVRTDETQNNATTRYIYDVNGWAFQYIVNETALTAEQFAAINSGITSSLVDKLNGIETGAQVNTVTSVNGQTGDVKLKLDPVNDVILEVPTSAVQGVLTEEQLATLQANNNNKILLHGECYRYSDTPAGMGLIIYTHNGQDGANHFGEKSISITIATRGWVLTVNKDTGMKLWRYTD